VKFLTLDPGETTGWATWEGFETGPPLDSGQADLWDVIGSLSIVLLETWAGAYGDEYLLHAFKDVQHVIMEDWAIYPWEAQNLAWDKCRTARGIGAIEFICQAAQVPYTLQPAAIKNTAESAAEPFFTTPVHENRHANDAIMHGVFFRLHKKFGTQAPAGKVDG
jgi:hypothetical protein